MNGTAQTQVNMHVMAESFIIAFRHDGTRYQVHYLLGTKGIAAVDWYTCFWVGGILTLLVIPVISRECTAPTDWE